MRLARHLRSVSFFLFNIPFPKDDCSLCCTLFYLQLDEHLITNTSRHIISNHRLSRMMSSSSSFPPPGAKKSEDTSNQKNRKGKRKKLDWTAQGSPSSNANSFTPRPNPVTPRLELPGKFRQHQNANSRAHPSRYINTRAENSSDSLVKAMERISIARASIKKQKYEITLP